MSLLGMLVAGLLSIALWYEVAVNATLRAGEKAAFAIGGILETILFIASVIGFVGAIMRKQSFLRTYAYILYIHFLFNCGGAAYLLYMIISFQNNIGEQACQGTITDVEAQDQCHGVFRVAGTVYIVVSATVLFVELYGAIIVSRHFNAVKEEKRSAMELRENVDTAFRLKARSYAYAPVKPGPEHNSPLYQAEFNPYSDPEIQTHTHSRSASRPVSGPQTHTWNPSHQGVNGVDVVRAPSTASALEIGSPPVPIEEGYGGGSWTHSQFSEKEKARLGESSFDDDLPQSGVPELTEEEKNRRRNEHKSIHGPSANPQSEGEPLPLYSSMPFLAPQKPLPKVPME